MERKEGEVDLIKPGDAGWKLGPLDRLNFRAGAATAPENFAVTAIVEGQDADPFDPVTHLFRYDSGDWALGVIPGAFETMLPFPNPLTPQDSVIAASWEGDVYIIDKSPTHEKIIGAGLLSDDSLGLGYISNLCFSGSKFFALGHGGQVFQREAFGWRRLWPEIADVASSLGGKFDCIDIHIRAGKIYVSGILYRDEKPMQTGVLVGSQKNKNWNYLPVSVGLPVKIIDWNARIFCVGDAGVAELDETGATIWFHPLKSEDHGRHAVVFRGEFYLATVHHLCKFMPKGFAVVTELPGIGPQQLQNLANEYLWAFGDAVGRFDGEYVKMFHLPAFPRR